MFCFEIKKGTRNAHSFLFIGSIGGGNTSKGGNTNAQRVRQHWPALWLSHGWQHWRSAMLPQLLRLNLEYPAQCRPHTWGMLSPCTALYNITGYVRRAAGLHLLLFLARVAAWAWDKSLIVAPPAQLDDNIWQPRERQRERERDRASCRAVG